MRELMPRRAVLRAGLTIGAGGLMLPAAACTPEPKPQQLTVAGGESGGFYLEFATLLAGLLQREGIAGTATPVVTGGSLDNVRRVLSGEATLAVALADTAVVEAAAHERGDGLVALGKVYENYVHCIVREDSGIRSFSELGGRTAAVGEVGSGTTLTAARIIAAAGLGSDQAPDSALKQVNLGLNQALAALQDGSIDVMIQSGGVPTAPVIAAAKDTGLRLLDLSGIIPATRAQSGFFYDRVLIPANSYGQAPAVWTVGVANLLLCRRDLPDALATGTVELLVEHARDLVPASSAGVQFLSPETLINTAGVPLHPAAAAAYRALHG
ncbi:TAXI family TRAP transporter solute-binding subunit [Paenarthrobacter sp. NPDC089714]|uniref:TAXI family TRAP transporter solute-binding subunit n=1 Tax=Paenarthrobacter sp. NPDC089714 TaxID=3364377 RepID=UPI0038196AF8